jgi:hypothetical protein
VLWELFHRKTPYDGREPMAVAVEVPNNLRPVINQDIEPELSRMILYLFIFFLKNLNYKNKKLCL